MTTENECTACSVDDVPLSDPVCLVVSNSLLALVDEIALADRRDRACIVERAVVQYVAARRVEVLQKDRVRGEFPAAEGQKLDDAIAEINAALEQEEEQDRGDDVFISEVKSVHELLDNIHVENERRQPYLMILDNGLMRSLSQKRKLDVLLKPRLRLLITDIVLVDAIANYMRKHPDEGGNYLAEWLERNVERITVLNTLERASLFPEATPEAALRQSIDCIRLILSTVESLIVVLDDLEGRALIKSVRKDSVLLGPRSFLMWANEQG